VRSVGHLWTGDRPVAEATICSTQQSQDTSTPLSGFEPAISTSERSQAYALDRANTAIGGCITSTQNCKANHPTSPRKKKIQYSTFRWKTIFNFLGPQRHYSPRVDLHGQRRELKSESYVETPQWLKERIHRVGRVTPDHN